MKHFFLFRQTNLFVLIIFFTLSDLNSEENISVVDKESIDVVKKNFESKDSKAFDWEKYFSFVVSNFKDKALVGIEKDLSGDFQEVSLGDIFKIMRHFNLSESFSQNIYSDNFRDSREAIDKSSFFSKLILLGQGLIYVNDSDQEILTQRLGKWLAYNDPSKSRIAKNLDVIQDRANEFLARSFFNPAPMDFSSTVRRSFEWADILLGRIKLINDFKKTKSKIALEKDDKVVVLVNDFALRCSILSVFERLFMLSSKYKNGISSLSPEDFSDFLGSVLLSLNQIFGLANLELTSTSVFKSSIDSLNYLIMHSWYGYEYSEDIEKKLSSPSAADSMKSMSSVRGFLKLLRDKSEEVKKTLSESSSISKKDRLSTYSPIYLFLPDVNEDEDQVSRGILYELINILLSKKLINIDDKIKLETSASK